MIDGLKSYPRYKNSGLPWVPDVPSHWRLLPNRALIRRRKVLVGERHPEYQLLSLTKQGVIVRDIESGKGKFSADMGTSQEVRAGDLVFCFFDVPETPRTVGLSRHNGMITGAYTVFECSDHLLAEFLNLFYRAMDDRKLLSPLYSGLRNTIPPSRFVATKTPVPSPEEQAAIVRYVDHVDWRIRRYIRTKRRLIALLNEQNQASIHRAVTRGLDPNVRLKPSGLPWVPGVPSHWDLSPNRSLMRRRKVLVGDRHPGYQLLSLTKRGVIVRDVESGKGKFSADMGTCQEVRTGDLVFCLFDVPETPRTVGLSRHSGMITGAYTVFECSDGLLAAFLELFYRAMDDRKLLSPLYSGLRNTIPPSQFLRIKTPVPPPDEQAAIVEYLEKAVGDISFATENVRQEIVLLREYRTRLMSDVVTGKLDVREAAARLPDEVEEPEPFGEDMEDAEDLVADNELETEALEEAEA